MVIKVRSDCKIDGCDHRVVAKGLCDMHRQRLAKHGHLDQTRPKDWGTRETHPLYGTWIWHKRKGNLCEEWLDFWCFVNDVVERPGESYALRRVDPSKPFSKDNAEWLDNSPINGEGYRKDKAAYARAYRKLNPDKAKNLALKKYYNINLDEYRAIQDAQGGVCAICGLEEFAINHHTGQPRELAVDHCHATGKVRGLLCTKCNKGIGYFNDSKELMEKAIKYLE